MVRNICFLQKCNPWDNIYIYTCNKNTHVVTYHIKNYIDCGECTNIYPNVYDIYLDEKNKWNILFYINLLGRISVSGKNIFVIY